MLAALTAASLPHIAAGQVSLPADQSHDSQQTVSYAPDEFPVFSFDELVTLSKNETLPPALESKLSATLHGVVLDNTFIAPSSPLQVSKLGNTVRAAEWNIERGENFDWVVAALKDDNRFRSRIKRENPQITGPLLDKITEQAQTLSQASILILNEVDLGMTRSQYHDVARELAADLKMNFVYGVEFVEVDPLKLGNEELTDADVGGDEELKTELESDLKADPRRYKGLHGSAILSRYPISNVRLVSLPPCYDWFQHEHDAVAKLEQGKRIASDTIFLEKIEREIRRGGRMAIIADLQVDDSPAGEVTVVNTHLENKCTPACRRRQMQMLLEEIGDVQNPLILSGDMNTTGADGSKLSLAYLVKSKVKDYRFWGRQAIMIGTPIPSLHALNYFKKYSDPTVRDIKFLSDNKQAAIFKDLQRFHFADDGQFDFRGSKERTVNGTLKRLASSNQRARKGFVYTFSLPRDFKGLVGRSKLDWFFIKPAYQSGERTETLAPWYARTMVDLNNSPKSASRIILLLR